MFRGPSRRTLLFGCLAFDPLWAMLLLTAVDVAGFGSAFRKVYVYLNEEQSLFDMIFVVRNMLVLAALEHYYPMIVMFSVVAAAACLLLVSMVVYRWGSLSASNR